MKKKITLIILLIFFCIGIFLGTKIYSYLKVKNAKIEVILIDDRKLEFNDKKRVSSFIKSINGTIIDDYIIDSTIVGKQNIKFDYVNNEGIKITYDYDIEVIDNMKPLIWLNNTYSIKKGSNVDLTNKILCGDNYDNNPNCYIEGEYNLNKTGYYDLVFHAIDSSGNENIKEFTLHVYDSSNKKNIPKQTYTKFSDILAKYKTDNTKIGIDVSSWQGNIDFEKIKEEGVEFIFIRVGYSKGTNGDYILDSKFLQNIEGASKYNIPIGIYFYSYANSKEHARIDAEWVLSQIKNYKIDMPIVFDWEEWDYFNQYELSFFELTNVAQSFLYEIEQNGYTGMLYSSKTYLENIWFETDYDIWLAHYTSQTNYEGKYKVWQLCDNGLINGINGPVDINIMYN